MTPIKSLDFSKLYTNYKGLWVALTPDNKVIVSDKSARKAYEKARKKGYEDPILFKVPTEDAPFIGRYYDQSHLLVPLRR
jgi:hypothetical protein